MEFTEAYKQTGTSCFSPNARYLAVAVDYRLVIRDVVSLKVLMCSPDGRCLFKYQAYKSGLGMKSVAWSPCGQFLSVGSYDQMLRVLNHLTWKFFAELSTVFVSPCGGATVFKEVDELLQLDMAGLLLSDQFIHGNSDLLSWSSDRQYLFTRNDNMPTILWVWNMRHLELAAILVQKDPIRAAASDPTCSRIVLCTGTSHLYMWTTSGAYCVSVPLPLFTIIDLKWDILEDLKTLKKKKKKRGREQKIMLEAKRSRLKKEKKMTTSRDDDHHYLPHEIVMEIIHRLPVKCVIRCGSVCKLWYDRIHNDPHFATTHFLKYSLKHPQLIFNIRNVRDPMFLNRFFYLDDDNDGGQKKNKDDDGVIVVDEDVDLAKRGTLVCENYNKMELVGYCNGFVCLTEMGREPGLVQIHNNSRREVLCIFPPIMDNVDCKTIGYGFGFDCVSKEYKVIFILLTANNGLFRCFVFTLGSNSWREVTAPPTHHRVTALTKSAIFCDGALFWRTTEASKMLFFDLHNDKFVAFPIPVDCVTSNKNINFLSLRIMEYKGSLSVARLEPTTTTTTTKLASRRENDLSEYNCKLHLHILKDKVKQVWTKESFDLSLSSFSIQLCKNISVVGFFNQVVLCRFDHQHMKICNPHTRCLKVIKSPYIILEKNRLADDVHYANYKLNSQVENFLSLQSFMPQEGALRSDLVGLQQYISMQEPKKTSGGYLCLYSPQQPVYYIFNLIMF